jgi:pimeloyl-ACP methyl ester carboxylesterase
VETFAFVHGAWHGAWCWEPLVRELESRGHRAVAVDLPCDDADAGCERYAEVVAAALGGLEEAIVVGHSLGGLTIPLVPARRLVFLCALVPRPGLGALELRAGEPEPFVAGFAESTVRDELGRSSWPDEATAIEQLYPDAPPELARAAFARLRPQARRPSVEPSPLLAWPDVECSSILAQEDGALRPEWSRWTARERLGIEPVELRGGHSPMLARPAELAALLTA